MMQTANSKAANSTYSAHCKKKKKEKSIIYLSVFIAHKNYTILLFARN